MANKVRLRIYTIVNGVPTENDVSVYVSDNSTRSREVMGFNKLTLEFSLPEYVAMPEVMLNYRGLPYYNFKQPKVDKKNDRSYAYTLEMYTKEYIACITMMRDVVINYSASPVTYTGGNRISFPFTGTAYEHLKMVVASLNYKEGDIGASRVWMEGDCIDYADGVDSGTEKCIPYDKTYVTDALNLIADTFDVEWEIVPKTLTISGVQSIKWFVNIKKVGYGEDNPLPLGYGETKGLKSGVVRTNSSSDDVIDLLYVQGTEQNIDPSRYGVYGEFFGCKHYTNGVYDSYVLLYGSSYPAKSSTLMLPTGGKIWYNGVDFKPWRPLIDGFTPADMQAGGTGSIPDHIYQSIGKLCGFTPVAGGYETHDVTFESKIPPTPTEYEGYTLYEVTKDRLAVRRVQSRLSIGSHAKEAVFDGTEVYPKRVGSVTSVDTVDHEDVATFSDLPEEGVLYLDKIYHVEDTDKWYICTYDEERTQSPYMWEELGKSNAPNYDFYDDAADCPDYSEYSIKGEVMTVIFQSGMLAGKEFELNTTESGEVINPYISFRGRKFEIVPQEIDGQVMPSPVGGFYPQFGDKYAIFHCKMPEEYIRKDIGKVPMEKEEVMTAVLEQGTGADQGLWKLTDSTPDYPDYADAVIDGVTPIIRFDTGNQAGHTFEVDRIEKDNSETRIWFRQRNIGGNVEPTYSGYPRIGDKYAIECINPVLYGDPEWVLKGAEWDLMREAVKYLHEHGEPTYTAQGNIDQTWLKENGGANIPSDNPNTVDYYLQPGGYVIIDDPHVPANRKFRIMSIQEKVNNPFDVSIILSDSMARTGFRTQNNRDRGEYLMPDVADAALLPARDSVNPNPVVEQ